MKRFSYSIIILGLVMVLSGCNNQPQSSQTSDSTTNNSESMGKIAFSQTAAPQEGEKIAIIKTTMGVIKVRLFPDFVPETVKNFETLATEGKYDGSIFHRVMKNFMIQGGDFEKGDGTGGYSYQGPGTTIAEEFSDRLTHVQGALSMAKTQLPHTTGSQFFIVHAKEGAHWLDNVHSVFGQVYQGMEVVDKIATTETGDNDRPVKEIKMEKVVVTDFGSEVDKEYK